MPSPSVAFEPVPLQTFISEQMVPQRDSLYGKKAGVAQACLVRDRFHGLMIPPLSDGDERYRYSKENPVMVVSTHTSKSVKLPVYRIDVPAVTLTMRDNFFDWKISVESKVGPVNDVFFGLFDKDEQIHPVYCEGFERDWVYGSFSEDQERFTVELHNDYMAWAFLFLLRQVLEIGAELA